MCESIRYEGGKAHGTTGVVGLGCQIVMYGNKAEEETYVRTCLRDDKGRVIFKLRVNP